MSARAAVPAREGTKARPLAPSDLEAVVAIDAALSGRARRAYFERRLAAARRDPERSVQLAVEQAGALAGFVLGQILEGEFGLSEPALRLETIGARPDSHGRGLGSALGEALEAEARRRGLAEIRTSARWREHGLLRFLDRTGYALAASHTLDCALADAALGSGREEAVEMPEAPRDANDYGTPGATGDFASLARDAMEVGLLQESDLEGIARIDRRYTRRERRGYLCRTIREGLADSAIRISLAARLDGGVAGYLMARLDYGDYGRAEPVAVIDTIGVDPLRPRQGIGRALLSQLFVNLRGLDVERVETVVAAGDLDLLGFFHSAGFKPAERLVFVKKL
jgi:predicted N-acetyltransferase YhbS